METLATQCSNQSLGPANQLLSLLIQTIFAAHCKVSPPEAWPADYGPLAIEKGTEN